MPHALRFFRQSPGFATVAVAILALGIGANVAVFSVLHAVLLAKLPVADPDRLVAFARHNTHQRDNAAFSQAVFREFEQATEVFAGVLAKGGYERVTVDTGGAGEPAIGELVSGSYFEVLGVRPHLGRLLNREDDVVSDGHPVVVLSHRFWQRRFAADPAVVGRSIRLGGRPMTIVGVSPPDFEGVDPGQSVDLRVPLAMQAGLRDPSRAADAAPPSRTTAEWNLMARLAPGVGAVQAQEAASTILRRYLTDTEPPNEARRTAIASERIELRPAAGGFGRTRAQFSSALWMLFALTWAVLIAACVNLAGLLIARTVGRQREFAVRAALGATTVRLARLLLTESAALTIAGAIVAVLIARPAASVLAALLSLGAANLELAISPGPAALLHTLGLTVLCGALVGLLPLWWVRRDSLAPALKTTDAATAAGRIGARLIAAEVAIAVVVLVCAGLFVRTVRALQHMDPGFRVDRLVTIALSPKNAGRDDARAQAFFRELHERLEVLPGIESVTFAQVRALTGAAWRAPVVVDGAADARATAARNVVGPDFFRTFGTTILAGRDFRAADHADAPRVAIVNESFARQHFADRDPIGRRIGANRAEYEIVGVVRDTRYFNLREEPPPLWYVPYEQHPGAKYLDLCVRTHAEPEAMLTSIRGVIAEVDPAVALFNVRTQEAQLAALLAPEQTLARLAAIFGASAAALVALGLYGLLAFHVQQQRRSLGIRLALGATPRAVIVHVVSKGMRCTLAGLACGTVIAVAATQFLAHLLYGVGTLDPYVFGAVLVVLAGVALLACLVPARRASRVDPMIALRTD